jgi:hypothetical protein
MSYKTKKDPGVKKIIAVGLAANAGAFLLGAAAGTVANQLEPQSSSLPATNQTNSLEQI